MGECVPVCPLFGEVVGVGGEGEEWVFACGEVRCGGPVCGPCGDVWGCGCVVGEEVSEVAALVAGFVCVDECAGGWCGCVVGEEGCPCVEVVELVCGVFGCGHVCFVSGLKVFSSLVLHFISSVG